ncbi:RNA polymerase sigma factor [Polyangium mundeleinium]|uniref:RNA polymerase sigma factor 70 region 4 type 2 domain-containing protein n=1 Tax=Polyangium mundeleinium TaxID=2995306 RepID=A0ABT5EK67_9BACT|nr:hypothetical protein [Polyangium mundeleinium]MDC0741573.1 hypothetical protein [Polyangium mundeleinium]
MNQPKKEEYDELIALVPILYERAVAKGVREQDAEDIVANVFVDVYAREKPLPSAPDERKKIVLAILSFRILTHIKERRALARQELVEGPAMELLVPDSRDAIMALEERQRIEAIWSRLRPEYRLAIEGNALGENAQETAARIGASVKSVETWLRRGRKMALFELTTLDTIKRPRGIRSVVVLVGLGSFLAAARGAEAFEGRVRGFFRVSARVLGAPLRVLPSVAAGVLALVITQPRPSASANEPGAVVVQAEPRGNAEAPRMESSACAPPPVMLSSVTIVSVPTTKPRSGANPSDRPSSDTASLSDAWLFKAKAALRRGNARRVLELVELDARARRQPDEDRENLRAAALRALAGQR